MVSELTAGYELLIPAMWVSAIAYLLSRGWSIYREQVPSRFYSDAHRGDFVIGVLKGVTVARHLEAGQQEIATFEPGCPPGKSDGTDSRDDSEGIPRTGQGGKLSGLFSLNQIRRVIYEKEFGQFAIVADIMVQGIEPLRPDTDLSAVLVRFAELDYEELPIVNSTTSAKVVGLLRRQDVITACIRTSRSYR